MISLSFKCYLSTLNSELVLSEGKLTLGYDNIQIILENKNSKFYIKMFQKVKKNI